MSISRIILCLLLLGANPLRAQSTVDADLTGDGFVDEQDKGEFILRYMEGDMSVDFDEDGLLTPEDSLLFSDALIALEEG